MKYLLLGGWIILIIGALSPLWASRKESDEINKS